MLLDTREERTTLWVDVRVPLGDCLEIEAALKAFSLPHPSDSVETTLRNAACLLHAIRIRQAAEKVEAAAQAASNAFDQWRD